MVGYSFLSCSKCFLEITGFLKKLPLFPICFGSGNFDFLIVITASEISLMVGLRIPFFLIQIESRHMKYLDCVFPLLIGNLPK